MPPQLNIHALLRLAAIPGVTNTKLRALVEHFGSPENVFSASPLQLSKVEGIKKELASTIAHSEPNTAFVDDQLKRINRVEGKFLTIWDEHYPQMLKEIFDAPVFLCMNGTFSGNDNYSLAIVGTRKPSAYGIAVAESFAKELSGMGITIISGLARGIDTHAHLGALKGEGRTIAVVGGAIDKIYPRENEKLAEKISKNGAILSEMFMGAKAELWSFPKRNRIISGISLGTIIIESDEDGGAMITARTALDQNRELYCLPGNITEHRSRGTNKLIKLGQAKLIASVDDILIELESKLKPLLKPKAQILLPQLSVFEQKIYDILSFEPIHIDVISEKSELSPSDALVNLLGLEFKGVVRQMAGKMFVKMM